MGPVHALVGNRQTGALPVQHTTHYIGATQDSLHDMKVYQPLLRTYVLTILTPTFCYRQHFIIKTSRTHTLGLACAKTLSRALTHTPSLSRLKLFLNLTKVDTLTWRC